MEYPCANGMGESAHHPALPASKVSHGTMYDPVHWSDAWKIIDHTEKMNQLNNLQLFQAFIILEFSGPNNTNLGSPQDSTDLVHREDVLGFTDGFLSGGMNTRCVVVENLICTPHDWEEGDLVLFNNHGVMHSIVGSFAEDEVRVFRQCNMAASRPPLGPEDTIAST